jgi:hypothetical protein
MKGFFIQYICQSIFKIGLLLVFCFVGLQLMAQEKKTTKEKIYDIIKQNIVTTNNDLTLDDPSKDLHFFDKYRGLIIKSIYIETLDFGEDVTDTIVTRKNFFARIGNKLQPGTKEFIIHQHLFIKEGDKIDPIVIEDNERYLRDLEFTKDARIYIQSDKAHDSASVYVFTRDVFSLGATFAADGLDKYKISAYDANVLGYAQKIRYTARVDPARNNIVGTEIYYKKSSVGGSLIDLETSYNNFNSGITSGKENETGLSVRLTLPLYTNHSRWAGGINYQYSFAVNVFRDPDTSFINYNYNSLDYWTGYNFIRKSSQKLDKDDQKRTFLAFRYYDQRFTDLPPIDTFNIKFIDKQYILGELRWYQLGFFRTNYIYGFGRTEDVPFGYTSKINFGRIKNDSIQSWYLGARYERIIITDREDTYFYTAGASVNLYNDHFSDNQLNAAIQRLSKLKSFRRNKLRTLMAINYSGIFNKYIYNEIQIGSQSELLAADKNKVSGTQLLNANANTNLYTPLSLIGFRLGFFVSADFNLLSTANNTVYKARGYTTLGGGMRVRNEDLIFGTVQLRVNWSPYPFPGQSTFEVTVSSNLKVKYSGSYVQAPTFTLLN